MKLRLTPDARRAGRGFAMLEALVALLICAMGVLGVVGLQSAMTRAQTAATLRAEAAFLAQQLVGEMWAAGAANLSGYATTSCNTACQDWRARVAARLPAGAATVTVSGTGGVAIEIRWTMAGESQSRYTVATTIN